MRWNSRIGVILMILVAVVALAIHGVRTRMAARVFDAGQLQFSHDVDLGTLPGAAIVRYHWVIRNDSDWPARLTWVSSDCGCISSTQPIAINAHDDGGLDIRLDTRGYAGSLHKRIVFSINSSESSLVELIVRGNVDQAMMDRPMLDLGIVDPGQQRIVLLQIRSPEGWSDPKLQLDKTVNLANGALATAIHANRTVELTATAPSTCGRFVWPFAVTITKSRQLVMATVYDELSLSVPNPLFDEPEIFLGSVREGEERWCERRLPLKAKLPDGSAICFPSGIEGRWKQVNGDSDTPFELDICIRSHRDWVMGDHCLTVQYRPFETASAAESYFIPLHMLVRK